MRKHTFIAKPVSLLLAAVVMFTTLVNTNHINANAESLTAKAVATVSGDLSLTKPTIQDLKKRDSARIAYDNNNKYEVAPSTVYPYSAGKLNDEYLTATLVEMNYVRYIAGLKDVTLSEEYTNLAQHASVLDAALCQLTHYPTQPADMDEDFYNLGYRGASRSNLYMGMTSLPSTIIGYCNDPGKSNTAAGHRRWILNPAMGATGFGFAETMVARDGGYYSSTPFSATYAIDMSVNDVDYDFVSWPASGYFPTNAMDSRANWTISLNPSKYANATANAHVNITREADGKVWDMDANSTPDNYGSSSYCFVNNSGYGSGSCIMVGLGNEFAQEGTYHVLITGITDKKNNPVQIKYDVIFINLDDVELEESTPEDPVEDTTEPVFGWFRTGGKAYWYEGGIRQGVYTDPKGVLGDGTVRGREIYDPDSDGWYWLDSCYNGAKAVGKEVWVPYIYQDELGWAEGEKSLEQIWNDYARLSEINIAVQVYNAMVNKSGKWIRYDSNGKMIKGWYTVKGADTVLYPNQIGNTYYYDPQTGLMVKGKITIDGVEYEFDENTGVLIH